MPSDIQRTDYEKDRKQPQKSEDAQHVQSNDGRRILSLLQQDPHHVQPRRQHSHRITRKWNSMPQAFLQH